MTMQDSVLNMEKVNRIQNTSLNIERNRQAREMGKARHNGRRAMSALVFWGLCCSSCQECWQSYFIPIDCAAETIWH